MDTLVVVLIVAGVVGFLLWKNKDRLAARINKPLEPAPGPSPTPVLPPVDVTPPPPKPTISRGLTYFEMLVVQGLDMETITRRMGRALSDDERAYARAHNVPGSAIVTPAAVNGDTGHDRKSLYWPVSGGSAIYEFEGPAGSVFMPSFPVPAGWRGTLKIGAYGERGGARIDRMGFTVLDAVGNALASDETALGRIGFDIAVDRDVGLCTAVCRIHQAGAGYIQLNVYPK